MSSITEIHICFFVSVSMVWLEFQAVHDQKTRLNVSFDASFDKILRKRKDLFVDCNKTVQDFFNITMLYKNQRKFVSRLSSVYDGT